MFRIVRLAVAVLPLLALNACSSDKSEAVSKAGAASDRSTASAKVSPADSSGADLAAGYEAGEFWDVFYMQDTKVGYAQTQIEPVVENGRTLYRVAFDTQLRLQRFGETVEQQIELSSLEDAEQGLVQFESQMSMGSSGMTTTVGRVRDGQLHLTIDSSGKRQQASLPWQESWGGLYAVDASLRADPMQPGEQRTIKALVPVFNRIGETTLKAGDYEPTHLLDGERKLLRIERIDDIGGQQVKSVLWTDQSGEPLKQYTPGMNQTAYRTSKKVALGEAPAGDFDLGEASIVKVDRTLSDPHATKKVAYRATLRGGDIKDLFASGHTQEVELLDEETVRVTVYAVGPDSELPSSLRDQSPPTSDDLAPNSLIQSDNPKIVEMARGAAPQGQDDWQTARALERFVHKTITSKNFSQAFATAAEVAESREGDCTEHSVLLAALCRAREIPARAAIGLVYYPGARGFAYHMWNEAWIDDRWVPLDATLGQGGVGAAHLKLVDSSLEGAGPYNAFLPVFQVLGQLELEIEEVE